MENEFIKEWTEPETGNLVTYDSRYFEVIRDKGEYLHYYGDMEEGISQPKGNTSYFRMFYECSSLRSLDLSNWDVSNVEDFRCMFKNCENLKSLDLSNWDMSNGKNFSHMFQDCWNLKSLNNSTWNVSNGKDFSCM